MSRKSLEELLADMAKRGELTHLSVYVAPNPKLFRATFAWASSQGFSHGEHEDPGEAARLAIEHASLRKRAPAATKTAKPREGAWSEFE